MKTRHLITGLLCQVMVALSALAQTAVPAAAAGLQPTDLAALDGIIQKEIDSGQIPGAVVLIGNPEHILYRKAFGYRALQPHKLPMREDTVFDLASLTKVIATGTAIMQLAEQGRLRLDNPIANYWPEFGANGKDAITVRHALTHYSGLRPDLPAGRGWGGYAVALDMITAQAPLHAAGSVYQYSDINFIILGELVQRIAGQPLDQYCAQHIFAPLGMRSAAFNPAAQLRDAIAPTIYGRDKIAWGEVHDPTAARMGGIAGHAGLFASADDLALFAQMLLRGGRLNEGVLLQPDTVALMTSPQVVPDQIRQRGLGWDLEAPLSNRGGVLVPPGFYGHTGYTGTSLWIDPVSTTYVIILTNRVHPNDRGDVAPLRTAVAAAVSSALGLPDPLQVAQPASAPTPQAPAALQTPPVPPAVLSGLDVMAAQQFAPLAGRRVGLITNHSGLDAQGQHIIDLLRSAPGVTLAAIFSPEHGLEGKLDEKIASGVHAGTALPVYSLYGQVTRPTAQMLEGLDALVFDVQDAGVRFYTYISTLGYAIEAAAKSGLDIYVLDRPNLINGDAVQGPVLDPELTSFTAYFPLPVRYGMTAGELAVLFNTENNIGAKLHVIKMRGYQRDHWYDETGLRWVNPSPNLRSVTEAALYPGVALVEGTNVSVGRGTDTPFELFGAPWIDAVQLANYLSKRGISGVKFHPVTFTPSDNRYKQKTCHGVRIELRDRNALDAPALGVEIASALHHLYPGMFKLEGTLSLIGARAVVEAIKEGQDPRVIARNWQQPLEEFRRLRERYLLY